MNRGKEIRNSRVCTTNYDYFRVVGMVRMGRGVVGDEYEKTGSSQIIKDFLSFCCSVTQSCPTLQPHRPQHTRLPCPSPSPGVCSNSSSLSQWCYPTISSSVFHFSCPQSLPASGSFPVTRLFSSGGQSIEASASVLPMNIQGWFPLGLTGFITLLSKGLSGVFSNTTVRKPQFFGAQPSLWSNSYICIWLLKRP